jgi:hypothetical protein
MGLATSIQLIDRGERIRLVVEGLVDEQMRGKEPLHLFPRQIVQMMEDRQIDEPGARLETTEPGVNRLIVECVSSVRSGQFMAWLAEGISSRQ